MKKTILTIIGCALVSSFTFSYADSNYGCKKKEQNLQRQLKYAEQHHNVHRAEGLKRALMNVRQYCGQPNYVEDKTYFDNDLQLNDDINKQNLNKKILQHKKKVSEAKYELEEAKLSGKPKKIRDKTRKLEERQQKLDYYLNELNKY